MIQFLPLEEAMAFHNVVLLIKSVLDKDKDKYYHEIVSNASNASNALP